METEDISRLFLTSLLWIAPEAIIAIDKEHNITLFNDGAENTFGYLRSEVLGQPINLLLPDRFRAAHTDHIRKFGIEPETARRIGERGEIVCRRRDGREFPAEAAICKIAIGDRCIYSVLLRDVTERKRQETRARILTSELEHRVHNILSLIRMVILRSANAGISLQEFQEALLDRVNSLVRAHGLLGRTHCRCHPGAFDGDSRAYDQRSQVRRIVGA